MAKLRFTDEDFSRMLPPDKGMHLFEVTETWTKPSSGKDSTNFFFAFKVIESAVSDSNVGRTMERSFNSKALGFMADFLSAVWNLPLEETVIKLREEPEIDTDDFIGEKVWNEVIDEMYKDRPVRKMSDTWAAASSNPPF